MLLLQILHTYAFPTWHKISLASLSVPSHRKEQSQRASERDRQTHTHTQKFQCCSATSNGYCRFRISATTKQSCYPSGRGGVRKVRFLRVHRGLHPCIHSTRSWAIPWTMDLRALRRGSERWGFEIRKAHLHRRSAKPPYQFLQEIQIVESFEWRSRAPDLCLWTDSPAQLGFSKIDSFKF